MNKKVLYFSLIPVLFLGVFAYFYFFNGGMVLGSFNSNAQYAENDETQNTSNNEENISNDTSPTIPDAKNLINEQQNSVTQQEPSIFEQLSQPVYSDPASIKVAAVNINASLVDLGVDATGKLEVPQNYADAGWYMHGTKAGENGNLIIAAHYDNAYAGPAAFWPLKNVNISDKVTVYDDFNRSFEYEIVDLFYVSISDPNRTEVFDQTNDATLTLITCGGVWLPGEATYDKRLVVKGRLITT